MVLYLVLATQLKNSVDAATSAEGVTQGKAAILLGGDPEVGENRGQHLTKHAPGCITMTGAMQGTVSRILVDGHEKSEGPTESSTPHCSVSALSPLLLLC
jgi:hypothetical protein